MADEQLWPTPRYAEEIVFEGRARLVIAPEEYEALYNAHEALRTQLEQAQQKYKEILACKHAWEARALEVEATIARQRAWVESAGHRPGCKANLCAHPNCDTYRHEIYHGPTLRGHLFQPGPCDCGYAELVGG